MQISLKVVLYKQKSYSDGTHPIMLQYILNRKVKRKVIARCKADDWDDKKNRIKPRVQNAARINMYISEEYSKAEHDLYDIKSGSKKSSKIFNDDSELTLQDAMDADLLRLKKEFKTGHHSNFIKLNNQITDKSVLLKDMDAKWFDRLIADCSSKGNNGDTIKKKIGMIRGLITRYSETGVSKEIKSISIPTQKPLRQKLSAHELQALVDLKLLEGELITATRDFFLLQVYLRGIRVGDLLQANSKDFTGGKFTYTADKTDKVQTIKLIPQALAIIERYTGKHDKLFPFFTWKPDKKKTEFENDKARLKHKEVCTAVINRYLKILAGMSGIKKPLSSHIARHTFARMAIDKINNPMVTMELLGHASMTVHQAYLNDIRKEDELDQAADDIFNPKPEPNK